jgi:hypothetical protein
MVSVVNAALILASAACGEPLQQSAWISLWDGWSVISFAVFSFHKEKIHHPGACAPPAWELATVSACVRI